jgi:hypothetical protein
MLSITFTPKVIGPDFTNVKNYTWLYDYLRSRNYTPNKFWNADEVYKSPNIYEIQKNLNNRIFNQSFILEYNKLTKDNNPTPITINYSYLDMNKINYPCTINIDLISIDSKVNIDSYFSIMLYPDKKICLIDDFYPQIYLHGWGGIGKLIETNLIYFLKNQIPSNINKVYVCSIEQTKAYWGKLGYLKARNNQWGSQFKLI